MAGAVASWIQTAISALGGGFLVSLGTLTGILINRAGTERAARDQRYRERVEELYRTLIDAERQFNELYVRGLERIRSDRPIEIPDLKPGEVAPLTRIEMMTNLYFPALKAHYQQLQTESWNIGSQFGPLLGTDPVPGTLEEKKLLRQKYIGQHKTITEAIKKLKEEVAKLARP